MKNLERLFAELKLLNFSPLTLSHGLLDGNPPFTVITVKLCPILLFVIL